MTALRSRLSVLLLAGFSLAACEKKSTRHDQENSLMSTMSEYLNDPLHTTRQQQFTVKDVTFFEDVNEYICEFHVRMVTPSKDTTGLMKAKISKDYKTVNRTY